MSERLFGFAVGFKLRDGRTDTPMRAAQSFTPQTLDTFTDGVQSPGSQLEASLHAGSIGFTGIHIIN
jgi:hypothetical protein